MVIFYHVLLTLLKHYIMAKSYLTEEESELLVRCLCCKNCLPPLLRPDFKFCNLNSCDFIPA